MPHVAVIEHARPASGTTVSVIDDTVSPAPRPTTVISVGVPDVAVYPAADVLFVQTGPDIVEVSAAGHTYEIAVEFFRAENLYVSRSIRDFDAESVDLEMADWR
jgi:hypothetical protein